MTNTIQESLRAWGGTLTWPLSASQCQAQVENKFQVQTVTAVGGFNAAAAGMQIRWI